MAENDNEARTEDAVRGVPMIPPEDAIAKLVDALACSHFAGWRHFHCLVAFRLIVFNCRAWNSLRKV